MTQRSGYIFGLGAYLSWGTFPIFFALLSAVDPFQIIPWRVISSMLFCLVLVSLIGKWRSVRAVFRDPRSLFWFSVSSLLLYANWQFFVIGVTSGRIIETALGYFINPLVTILVGVVIRRERLRRAQWVAVGIAFAGVLTSSIAYGKFPWIAIALALSFGLYGSVRKIANEEVDAVTGLAIETIISTPVAIGQLILVWVLAGSSGPVGGSLVAYGPTVMFLLIASGIVTAVPLIFFGAANRRLPLTHMGFMQFITPILSFLTGYFIFHEEMPLSRWIGFLAVWVALVVLLTDMVKHARATTQRRRRL